MRFLLSTFFLVAFAFQVVSGQEPAAEYVSSSLSGWRTVLEAGALVDRPDIVTVDEGGFAISADSFVDPTRFFDSEWILYDPNTDRWSNYGGKHEPSQLVNLDQLSLVYPDISRMLPSDAEPGIQLVDRGSKAVFLVDAGENLADHTHYFGVNVIDLATGAVTKTNIWSCWGLRHSDDLVWEFPKENLIVSCYMLIWYDSDPIRTEWISAYIGQGSRGMLHLLSTSPDNRYWILEERFWYDPWYGDTYLFDRKTGWITVLLWRERGRVYNRAAWLSDSTFIVNEGDYVMHFDTGSFDRRYALADELVALPDSSAYWWLGPYLSRDGQWLLVFTEGGGLVLRNVFDALAIHS